MKTKLFTLLTLLVLCVTGAWAEDVEYIVKDQSFTGTETNGDLNKTISNATFAFTTATLDGTGDNMKIKLAQNGTITLTAPSGMGIKSIQMVLADAGNTAKWTGNTGCTDGTSDITGSWLKGTSKYSFSSSNLGSGTFTFTPTNTVYGKSLVFTLGTKSNSYITISSLKITYIKPTLVGTFEAATGYKVGSSPSAPILRVTADNGASITKGTDYGYTITTDNSDIVTIVDNEITAINTSAAGIALVTATVTSPNGAFEAPASSLVLNVVIYSENRTYAFNAPTAADLTALKGNTAQWEDNTSSKYIKNKVQFDKNVDYALTGSDGKYLSIAQGILYGNDNDNAAADKYRYYYKDGKYYFNAQKANTYIKIPNVGAGQKIVLKASGGSNRKIGATNATPAEYDLTSTSETTLTFVASADGTVTLTGTGGSFNVYSIQIYTPTYYTVEYDLNGGTGTTPTETDKEEGDVFTLHDGVTGITVPSGKEFSKWVDQDDNEYDGGAEFTMPAKNVTLTAKWAEYVVKHTITYAANGGTGEMASTLVVEGEDQELPASTFFKELNGFTGWTADVDVTIGGATVTAGTLIADGATIQNVTGDITLTAQWAQVYANGTYTFENNATVGTAPDKTVTTTATEYPAFRLDNLFFTKMTIQYEEGEYSGSGDDFKGWKIKTSGAKIKFMVENDQAVTIGVGNLSSGAKVSYTALDGSAKSDVTLTAKSDNLFLVKGGTTFTFETTGSSTVTLKKIAITDIPTATITTNKGKWTSFTPSWNATLESGAKAYFVTAITASTITATAVDVLKAGEGYFVKGEAATTEYTATATDAEADATTGTLLVGQTAATTINATTPDSNDKFVLGTTSGGKSGLFKVTGDVTVAAGKAYLNAQATGLANSLSLDFEDGGTTGIQQVEAQQELLSGDFYNLKGQRVALPTKGLYIVNGRKVVVK